MISEAAVRVPPPQARAATWLIKREEKEMFLHHLHHLHLLFGVFFINGQFVGF